eukprot:746239-Hanusia_phi.AAC.20
MDTAARSDRGMVQEPRRSLPQDGAAVARQQVNFSSAHASHTDPQVGAQQRPPLPHRLSHRPARRSQVARELGQRAREGGGGRESKRRGNTRARICSSSSLATYREKVKGCRAWRGREEGEKSGAKKRSRGRRKKQGRRYLSEKAAVWSQGSDRKAIRTSRSGTTSE